MQSRKRDKRTPGFYVVIIGLTFSLFLNVYLLVFAHGNQHHLQVTIKSLQQQAQECTSAMEERMAQLDLAIKSKQAAKSRLKLIEVDCGTVSTWFQQLWDAVAELFHLPEGDNEDDLRELLKRLGEEISHPQENSFPERYLREQDYNRELTTRDKMLNVYKEYTHASVPRNLKVYWATECGCTGIQVEALNLVYPLWKKGMQIRFNPCTSPCDFTLLPYLQTMIDEMAEIKWGLKDADVVVAHYSYNGICPIEKLSKKQYNVMRTMFETDGLEPAAVIRCNSELLKEIWVPTDFNVKSMGDAGVKTRLLALPESLDVHLYDPTIAKNQEFIPEAVSKIKELLTGYNFFSNFKFESRKNWKGLIRAFVQEFERDEDVALFLFTHKAWEGDPIEMIGFYLTQELNMSTFPQIHVIDERMSSEELPYLYSIMDAFVLPTHGEGWGLPMLEAMLMELPLIVTDWGGSAEFAGGPNFHGFPLLVQKLAPAWGRSELGNWAVPSHEDLRTRLREVFTNREQAKRIGKMARADVVWKYSQEAVALQYLRQFKIIEQTIIAG